MASSSSNDAATPASDPGEYPYAGTLPSVSLETSQGRFVGHGSHGRVMLEKVEGISIAEKTVLSKDLTRFEMQMLKRASGPHTVHSFELYAEPRILMKYMSNGFLNPSDVKETDKIYVCLDIIRGIRWIHSRNILHSDLKPDNILYSGSGKIKIIDFGLADHPRSGTKIFTDQFSLNNPLANKDVYAFGIIALSIVDPASYKSMRDIESRSLSEISVVRQELIDRFLATRPDNPFIDLIGRCLLESDDRPSSEVVFQELEEIYLKQINEGSPREIWKKVLSLSSTSVANVVAAITGNPTSKLEADQWAQGGVLDRVLKYYLGQSERSIVTIDQWISFCFIFETNSLFNLGKDLNTAAHLCLFRPLPSDKRMRFLASAKEDSGLLMIAETVNPLNRFALFRHGHTEAEHLDCPLAELEEAIQKLVDPVPRHLVAPPPLDIFYEFSKPDYSDLSHLEHRAKLPRTGK